MQAWAISTIQIHAISTITYLTLVLAHVIVTYRTSQHYSSRGPNSYHCLSAIDPLGRAAHKFHHILCVNAWQKDGRNDFGFSVRPHHLHREVFHVGDATFSV